MDIRERGFPGGKGKAFRHVINLMPPHVRYVEAFLGSGAVLRNKRPAQSSLGIEIDETILAGWRGDEVPGLEILPGDAISILPRLNLGKGDLLYCDPPYVPSTRRGGRYYRHELSQADHVSLLAVLTGLPCKVVLSGYRCGLYDEALGSWHRIDYVTTTHAGPVTESAWTNFVPGPPLHDYSYVGANFREREGFRRRSVSLAGRIASTDPLELHAALALVADERPEAVRAAADRIAR